MASEERFGYKWNIIKSTPNDQKVQFNRWINTDDLTFFKDKNVLDAGCGIGTNSEIALVNGASHVTCVDAFEDTLIHAKNNLSSFPDSKVDVKYLNLEIDAIDSKYQIVMCLGVLHHLRNQKEVLHKLLNAVDDNGRIFIWIYGKHNHVFAITLIDLLRKITCRLPIFLNRIIAKIISIPSYYLILPFLKGKYYKQLSTFQYNHFEGIVLDQLLPAVSTYYTEKMVKDLIKGTNLQYKHDSNNVGWTLTNK